MVTLLILHFLSDFILQSRKIATTKSSDPYALLEHIGIIFVVFLPFVSLQFNLANILVHALIDWNIWKFYKHSVLMRLGIEGMDLEHPDVKGLKDSWKYWEDHMFYTIIGFDQLLHTLTLVLLSQWGI